MKPRYDVLVLLALAFVFSLGAVLLLGDIARGTIGEVSAKAGPVIAIAIAFLSRRRPIGGWLLCYYLQISVGIVLTTALFVSSYQELAPSRWNSAIRYVMFILSIVPLQLVRIVEAIVAIRLLLAQSIDRLRQLRWVLVAMVIASSVAVSNDLFFFPTVLKISIDVLGLGFSVMWLVYFMRAKRIQAVFIDQSWEHFDQNMPKRELTPEDKKRLTIRALVASVTTFAVFLTMMGFAIGDKKPDMGIFFIPLFVALMVALVAWRMPLRKRGSGVQGSPEPTEKTAA